MVERSRGATEKTRGKGSALGCSVRFTRGDVGRHTGPTTSYQTCAVVGDSGEKYGARGAATGTVGLSLGENQHINHHAEIGENYDKIEM